MLSITDAVRVIVQKNQLISETLSSGLLNTSEYARQIQTQVEQITYKKVQLPTIVTSLNRIKTELVAKTTVKFVVDDILLKYPISDIVFGESVSNHQKITNLYEKIGSQSNNFLNVIEGNTETNIFVNSGFVDQILETFLPQKPIYTRFELAGITLKFSPKYIDLAGSTFSVLRAISLEGINLVEVLSTYTEITIFVDLVDSQRVIEIIQANFLTKD